MLRRLSPWFLVALAAACASTQAPVPGSPTPEPNVRQVPERVGEFRRIDVHRFPDPALGVAYRFTNGSPLRLDVYVYPLTDSARAAGEAADARAAAEGRQLRPILQQQQEIGNIRSFRILSDSLVTLTLPGRTLRGSHVAAQLVIGGRTQESHQHVFVLGDQLVKVRASFPPGALPVATIDQFIADLLRAMVAAPGQDSQIADAGVMFRAGSRASGAGGALRLSLDASGAAVRPGDLRLQSIQALRPATGHRRRCD